MVQSGVVAIHDPMLPARQYWSRAEPSCGSADAAASQVSAKKNVVVIAERVQRIEMSKDIRLEEVSPVYDASITLEDVYILKHGRRRHVLIEVADFYLAICLAYAPTCEPDCMIWQQA
jgi:hypothetical protein